MNYQNKRFAKLFAGLVVAAIVFTILPRFIFASIITLVQLLFWVGFFYFLYQVFGRRRLSNYRMKRKFKKDKPPAYYSDRR